jgi:hypothetical protein
VTDRPKQVAIVQSNYIPWKGYFDMIDRVDEFILLDEVQYTKRDWRNRNRIKTPQGVNWLTVPVQVKGKYHQRIDETRVADGAWADVHWKTLSYAYGQAPFFATYRERVAALYEQCGQLERLSDVNRRLLEGIAELIGITTPLSWSTDYEATAGRTERLVDLCVQAKADVYLSGPAAKSYLDESLFERQGVAVAWMTYSDYPEYPQPHPPFDHHVTCLDLLFSVGPDARRFVTT